MPTPILHILYAHLHIPSAKILCSYEVAEGTNVIVMTQASEPLNVTIVNRGDDQGRHILNEQATRKRIQQEFRSDVGVVR